jgi:hypothetical protein
MILKLDGSLQEVAEWLTEAHRNGERFPVEYAAAAPFLVWGMIFGAYMLAVMVSLSAGSWLCTAVSLVAVMANACAVFYRVTIVCARICSLVMGTEHARLARLREQSVRMTTRIVRTPTEEVTPVTHTFHFDDELVLVAAK